MSKPDHIYTLDIAGFLDAEGSAYEAGAENTITGIRWTLRGHLAMAVHLLIEAERDQAIAACEAQKAIFASDEYATPQPLGGLMERFACDRCIEAIRKGTP